MILVTGATGLLGRELVHQLLARQKEVLALCNKTALTGINHPLLKQEVCNILDVVQLENIMQQHAITSVFHCAAIVSFHPARKQELFKINIEGTANVVNASLNAGVTKLVHVSSVAALGRFTATELVTERMSWTEDDSNSHYGKSKYLGEMEVWRGIGEGLDAVIVNPSIILGAGDWNAGSARIFQSVYNNFPWYSDGVNGFVDVRDVAAAMIQLMESDVSNERFILNAANCSYQHLFTMIAKAFNKKPPHKRITPLLAGIVWRWEMMKSWFTKKEPLVTRETAATALAHVRYNNEKLLRFLPQFSYTPIEDSIQHTCAVLQQKLNS